MMPLIIEVFYNSWSQIFIDSVKLYPFEYQVPLVHVSIEGRVLLLDITAHLSEEERDEHSTKYHLKDGYRFFT